MKYAAMSVKTKQNEYSVALISLALMVVAELKTRVKILESFCTRVPCYRRRHARLAAHTGSATGETD